MRPASLLHSLLHIPEKPTWPYSERGPPSHALSFTMSIVGRYECVSRDNYENHLQAAGKRYLDCRFDFFSF